MSNPSFSELDRTMICAGSAVLPHNESVSDAAERGTVLHEFFKNVALVGREAALALVPEDHYEAAEIIDVDQLPATQPGSYDHEVGVVYDVEANTGRILGSSMHHGQYVATGAELAGVSDIVGLTADGDGVIVGDYKTGWARPRSAAEAWQLRIAAVALTRATGRHYAEVFIVRTWQDRTPPWYDHARFDAFALDGFIEDLAAMWRRIQLAMMDVAGGRRPPVVTGSHCRYCHAVAACHAQTGLVVQMATAPEQIEKEIMTLLTPENAARAWERLAVVREIVARMVGQFQVFAGQHPIVLRDGQTLGPRYKDRDALDSEGVYKIVRDELGQEFADLAVARKATKKGLQAVSHAYAKTKKDNDALIMDGGLAKRDVGKIGATNQALLTMLERRGAITETKKVVVDVHPSRDTDAAALAEIVRLRATGATRALPAPGDAQAPPVDDDDAPF